MNLNIPIRDLNDEPFGDGSTVQSVILQALQAPLPDDEKISGVQKFKLFKLALRIAQNDDVEMTAEEIALVKERVSKAFRGALVTGRVWEALDPAETGD